MSFEERYNRWIDGLLDPADERALREELARRGIPADEAEAVRLTGDRLRAGAPALDHPDVFREQILDRIRHERAADTSAPPSGVPRFGLAWSGLGLVALAVLGFVALIPKPWHGPREPTEIYSLWTEADRVSAVAVRTPDRSGSVVWLDGLDYLPASHDVLH